MYTHTHKNPVLFVAALLALVALTSLACTFSGVRMRTNSPVIDVTFDQNDIDQLHLNTDAHANHPYDQLLDEITRIELHDGFIRFLGTVVLPDWSEVDGSFDMSLGAENGVLKARIIAVNIPGIDLNDWRVLEINNEWEDDLTQVLVDSHGEVLFKEVVVQEDELRIKVQVYIDD